MSSDKEQQYTFCEDEANKCAPEDPDGNICIENVKKADDFCLTDKYDEEFYHSIDWTSLHEDRVKIFSDFSLALTKHFLYNDSHNDLFEQVYEQKVKEADGGYFKLENLVKDDACKDINFSFKIRCHPTAINRDTRIFHIAMHSAKSKKYIDSNKDNEPKRGESEKYSCGWYPAGLKPRRSGAFHYKIDNLRILTSTAKKCLDIFSEEYAPFKRYKTRAWSNDKPIIDGEMNEFDEFDEFDNLHNEKTDCAIAAAIPKKSNKKLERCLPTPNNKGEQLLWDNVNKLHKIMSNQFIYFINDKLRNYRYNINDSNLKVSDDMIVQKMDNVITGVSALKDTAQTLLQEIAATNEKMGSFISKVSSDDENRKVSSNEDLFSGGKKKRMKSIKNKKKTKKRKLLKKKQRKSKTTKKKGQKTKKKGL